MWQFRVKRVAVSAALLRPVRREKKEEHLKAELPAKDRQSERKEG